MNFVPLSNESIASHYKKAWIASHRQRNTTHSWVLLIAAIQALATAEIARPMKHCE
jgi:hypothetical protein